MIFVIRDQACPVALNEHVHWHRASTEQDQVLPAAGMHVVSDWLISSTTCGWDLCYIIFEGSRTYAVLADDRNMKSTALDLYKILACPLDRSISSRRGINGHLKFADEAWYGGLLDSCMEGGEETESQKFKKRNWKSKMSCGVSMFFHWRFTYHCNGSYYVAVQEYMLWCSIWQGSQLFFFPQNRHACFM